MHLLLIILLLAASSVVSAQHEHRPEARTDKKAVWLDNGLGNVDHPVTTKHPEAQKYFNQGLAYLYAFNHAEGIKSFRRAAELDPDMAMAQWGISLALGSNYNVSADAQQLTDAYAALQKAIQLAPKANAADQAFIKALSSRYAKDPATDRTKLASDYKTAMGELVKQYPDDLDAATLYAESMMNLRPWQLWSLDGKPAEGTLEIVAVLESVLRRDPRHTGANHYYIHAIEASPTPERGMAAAARLGGLAPNAGHLVHMPSHIYLRTGDFDEAAKSNDLAIVADRNYIQKSGAQGVYPLMYYNHNIHMLAASYVGSGNYAGAIKAASDLEANVGPNVAAMPMLEMFMPYRLVTLIRFHKADEIMKYPQPPASMKIQTGFWRFARGLALAEIGRAGDADRELIELRALIKSFPPDASIGNNTAEAVFTPALEMLTGEIALAKGDRASAVESLKRAVAAEDLVNYNEPPDLDIPVREWLGRANLRSGRFAEAEEAYRSEIAKHPRNGRALFGLAEALTKQGKASSAALVAREFERAWANSDTKLTVEELYGKSGAATPAATKTGENR
jgi:tetratricopeptide (TPR) repeat protein